jgi:SAM-dependent methyltransferase
VADPALNEPQPAGDVNYAIHGQGYANIRRPDPRIAALIHKSLGNARTVLNIGAGTGSYEPEDRHVIAIEPSATMRAQRPKHLAPAIHGIAEQLPLDDQSVDASMAIVTVHQWRDLQKGLSELRRVTRGPIVVMTFDAPRWIFTGSQYAPELIAASAADIRYRNDRARGSAAADLQPYRFNRLHRRLH